MSASNSLPAREPTRQATERPAPEGILIAEDNPTNQRVAQRLVERLGYRAGVAIPSGQTATA